LVPTWWSPSRFRSENLGRFSRQLQRCTVTVEGSGGHHRQGLWSVRINLVLPGTELVVHKHSQANPEGALKAAFQAVGRRLADTVRKGKAFVQSHLAS
jgi:hypothetical protein